MRVGYIATILGIAISIFCGLLGCSQAYENPLALALAKVTLKVVDENQQAIDDAGVHLGFRVYTKGGWGSKSKGVTGHTNKEGLFDGWALANDYVGFTVNKSGYYESGGEYKFKEHSLGRWQPWNPEIKVVMRKRVTPVPMYARDTHSMYPAIEMPVIGKSVGFDFMESDWVSPYGKGKHPDMFFKLERKFVSNDDFEGTLTVTFPNKYDGIHLVKYNRKSGSEFKLPRFAPEEGYQSKLVRIYHKKPGEQYVDSTEEDNNYFFRVRSEEKDGKFFRAMYGKIHGDIRFGLRDSKTASIVFKYFLNPAYARNLEWSGENLLRLPRGEQMGMD